MVGERVVSGKLFCCGTAVAVLTLSATNGILEYLGNKTENYLSILMASSRWHVFISEQFKREMIVRQV